MPLNVGNKEVAKVYLGNNLLFEKKAAVEASETRVLLNGNIVEIDKSNYVDTDFGIVTNGKCHFTFSAATVVAAIAGKRLPTWTEYQYLTELANVIDSVNKGAMFVALTESGITSVWCPLEGCRILEGGALTFNDSLSAYWGSTPSGNGSYNAVYCLCFLSDGVDGYMPALTGEVESYSDMGITAGVSVRLIKDISQTADYTINVALDLSPSALMPALSANNIVKVFNVLRNRVGQTKLTITLGSANLAKLTTTQKAIATSKNYTLA